MTRTEHLLTILAEECAEVAQRASKALRFGETEVELGQRFDNRERIMHEMADLFAVYQMLGLATVDIVRIEQKKQKVEHFLDYAEECGTLTTPLLPQEETQI